MKFLPLNNQQNLNEIYLIVGVSAILFLGFIKLIFTKYFNSLLNYKQFLILRDKSSILLSIVYVFFSFYAAYFVVYVVYDNQINTFSVNYFLLIVLNFFIMYCVKSFVYTILWYVLNFNRKNLDVFFNIHTYFVLLKIIILILCYFLFYFSPFPKEIILIATISSVIFLIVLANIFLFVGFRANGTYQLHIPLYLLLIEFFPLLYLFKTINTFL